ncbi:MAG: hypothetical protein ACI81T_004349 [Bacteroidia bacterium]|jgi:hypothetical protein
MTKQLLSFVSISLCLIFTSCTPHVGIVGSWKNAEKTILPVYHNVFLATMMSDELISKKIQTSLAKNFSEQSVESTNSYSVFPEMYAEDSKKNRKDIFDKVNETKSEVILLVSTFDVEMEKDYSPNSSTQYTPSKVHTNMENFWSFYSNYRPRIYADDFSDDRVYYLEADLFDVKEDKLIWSIQTKTYNPTDLSKFTEGFAQTVVKEMKKDGIIE